MKLIDFSSNNSYGKEYNFYFLKGEKISFLQISLGWYEEEISCYFQMSSGFGRLFSFLLCLGKLSISFDLIGPTWKF